MQATSFRAVLRPPLAEDPLLKGPAGLEIVETFRGADRPVLALARETAGLDGVLAAGEPRFGALAVVPVRGVDRLLGFFVLYYLPDQALPATATLDHLEVLARILRTSLDLAVARGAL
jgi:hypothetical protein